MSTRGWDAHVKVARSLADQVGSGREPPSLRVNFLLFFFPKILALKANLRSGKTYQILNEMKKIDLDSGRGDHVFINILRPLSG